MKYKFNNVEVRREDIPQEYLACADRHVSGSGAYTFFNPDVIVIVSKIFGVTDIVEIKESDS